MDFFLKLSEIGRTQIVDLFNAVLVFFTTDARVLLTGNKSAVISNGSLLPGIFGNIDKFFKRFKFITSDALTALGFNLDVPMWEFMLSNIGLILSALIIIKLLDFIN